MAIERVALGYEPRQRDKPAPEAATGAYVGAWRFADSLVVTMTAPSATGTPKVRGVQISAPSKLRTAEGIGIGSSLADVKKAYGRYLVPPSDGGTAWTVGGGMMLTIDRDKVWAIFLGPLGE